MKNFTVLIPDGEHTGAINVVRSLGLARRVRIEVASSERGPAAGLSRHCRKIHRVKRDADRVEAVLDVLKKSRADVLMPASLETTREVIAAKKALAEHVSLPPLPELAEFDVANDKIALSQLALQHGVPVPPFRVFPDDACDLRLPVLVKNPTSSSGRDIRLINDPASLAQCLGELKGDRYLFQNYVAGDDYGLNVLCRDGRIVAHTVQKNPITVRPPFGPSAGIHFVQDEEVLEIGRRILSVLNWNGVANLDMLRSKETGELLLLEINPRYWGTLMGSVRAGVNFPYLACLAALGDPLPESRYEPVAYADKPAALDQIFRWARGRSDLPGFRPWNTALTYAFTDPMPTLSAICQQKRRRASNGRARDPARPLAEVKSL